MLPLALLLAGAPLAQGLQGLGAPGSGLLGDPKVIEFENELFRELNARRAKRNLPPLAADQRLRTFTRKEAELAARGDPEQTKILDRIKTQGLAPYGYYYHFAHGSKPAAVAAQLDKDKAFAKALYDEFAKGGVGAFAIGDGEYQLAVMFTREPDPMAGKPGLSQQQTDSVMNIALPKFKECYDKALKHDPNVGGDVLLKVVIRGDGTVGEGEILKSLGSATFDACAAEVIRGLRFPKPYKERPVTLNHPLRFTPPQGSRKLGRLTQAQIDIAFRQASYDFRACFDARAKEKPELAGTLTLALTVLPSGGIDKLRLESDGVGDKLLADCVLGRARELRFPAPEYGGEVDITYPLRFERSPQAK